MKHFHRWFKEQSRYFRQIVIHIYLISLFAVMLVGAILFRQSIKTLEYNYNLFSTQLLSNTSLLTESRIKAAISLAIGAYNSQEVMPYLLSDRFNANNENKAVNALRNRIGLNDTIHSAFIYNSHYPQMAMTMALYNREGDLSKMIELLLAKGFPGNIRITLNQAWESKDLSFGKRDIVSLIYKNDNWDAQPVHQAIVINIKEDSFLQPSIAMPGEEIGKLFILNGEGKVVSHLDKTFSETGLFTIRGF